MRFSTLRQLVGLGSWYGSRLKARFYCCRRHLCTLYDPTATGTEQPAGHSQWITVVHPQSGLSHYFNLSVAINNSLIIVVCAPVVSAQGIKQEGTTSPLLSGECRKRIYLLPSREKATTPWMEEVEQSRMPEPRVRVIRIKALYLAPSPQPSVTAPFVTLPPASLQSSPSRGRGGFCDTLCQRGGCTDL